MSDALTDIARDNGRASDYHSYMKELLDFVSGKSSKENVRKKAEDASGGSYGYWSGPLNLTKDLDRLLEGLWFRNGNRQVWAELLYDVVIDSESFLYWEAPHFHDLSPFWDKILISVDYGCGFSFLKCLPAGYVSKSVINGIIKDKDWITRDCDKYLVVLNSDGKTGDTYWIKNSTRYSIKKDGSDIYHNLKIPRLRSDWDDSQRARKKYCGYKEVKNER